MTDQKLGQAPRLGWPLGPVAHRGLHDAAKGRIENTESAFAAALAKGYAIECDLQSADDGEPVVFHDEALERLMDATGLVAAHTVAGLKQLRLCGTGDRIQSLDELLEQVAGRVPLLIEIKTLFGQPGHFEDKIAARLRAYQGPVAVMSFDHRSTKVMRALAPGVPRGLLSYRWDDDWVPQMAPAEKARLRGLSYAADVDPSFIAYDIDDLPEPAPLDLKAQLGIPLFTWTVRTPEQRERAKLYADAIIFEGFEA
jgi:glycerophosphoryl diester phosphodiesterase